MTLRRVLVSIELYRRAGHAGVVREVIDGAVGVLGGNTNMPASWRAGPRLTKIAAAPARTLKG